MSALALMRGEHYSRRTRRAPLNLQTSRTIAVCQRHSVPIKSFARKVASSDYDEYDYMIAMDEENRRNLEKARPKTKTPSKAKIVLFGSFEDKAPIIDPYYGSDDGFEVAYQQSVRYSNGLLDEIAKL